MKRRSSKNETKKSGKCARYFNSEMFAFLSNFFFRVGHVVSTNPMTTIYLTFAIVFVSMLGVLWMNDERDPYNLWLPKESSLHKNKLWLDKYFPQNTSSESPVPNGFIQSVIVSGENVLRPDVIKNLYRMHHRIVSHRSDYEDRCIRMEEFQSCANFSVLRLWDYDEKKIMNMTEADLAKSLRDLRTRVDKHYIVATISNFWQSNNNDSIAGAKAVLLHWNMHAHRYALWYGDFEENFYKVAREMKPEFDNLVYSGGRSFDTESKSIMERELKYVLYGYSFVFLYMITQMSYDGRLMTGVLVSLSGLLTVGLAVSLMVGFCSLMGYFWSNVHLIIPAILLGIGIDDMFVVTQALKNKRAIEYKRDRYKEKSRTTITTTINPLTTSDGTGEEMESVNNATSEIRVKTVVVDSLSRILHDVGLSIFVTSLSDALAFAVGTTFIMPATSSMCVWLAVGISFIFALMNTFFIACLSLIERMRTRQKLSRRSAEALGAATDSTPPPPLCCRPRHPDKFSVYFKKYYVPLVANAYVQVVVVGVTIGILGVCFYGLIKTQIQWDVWSLIPMDSFLHQFKTIAKEFFPSLMRTPMQLIFRDLDFHRSTGVIKKVLASLSAQKELSLSQDWVRGFEMYLRLAPELNPEDLRRFPLDNMTAKPSTRASYYFWLQHFINSSVMGTAEKDLYFNENVTHVDNATGFVYHPLKACKFTYTYKFHFKTSENMGFLDSLHNLVYNQIGLAKDTVFIFSQLFISLEQARFLPWDLGRNLCISLVLIGFVIFLFFADARMGFLCSFAVFLSLLDVFGLLHFFGLTLEPVTAMTMVILIGLGIDFSVHLGHSFIASSGTRAARVAASLGSIGPAVIHGGVSTVIAMAPLVVSNAYAFTAFSKLIVSMVIVGLWHGLAFLPVLLFWMGPQDCEEDDGATGMKRKRKIEESVHRRRKKVVVADRSCVCSCVERKKVRTVTYFGQADDEQKRSPPRRPSSNFLVVPPPHVRQWIAPAFADASLLSPRALPRIPRARTIWTKNSAAGRSTGRSTGTNGRRDADVYLFTGLDIRRFHPTLPSVASSHPACPPTPRPPGDDGSDAVVVSTGGSGGSDRSVENPRVIVEDNIEKDSLFNSSYHPTTEESNAVSTSMTLTPAASLTSLASAFSSASCAATGAPSGAPSDLGSSDVFSVAESGTSVTSGTAPGSASGTAVSSVDAAQMHRILREARLESAACAATCSAASATSPPKDISVAVENSEL